MVTRIGSSKPYRHYLKEWRLKKEMTQQKLADRLPVGDDGKPTGKDQISRWERNERGMTMDVQMALTEALGLDSPADLFRDPNTPSADELLKQATPQQRRQVFFLIDSILKAG